MKIKTTPSVVIRVLLWVLMLIGGIWFGISYDIKHFQTLFFNLFFHIVTFIIGYILMRLAFKAAATGGKELAKRGRSGDIPHLETNCLVTTGIYTQMRHPMLFGLMLVPLALALLIGSPSFILIIAPIEMLFILIMVLIFEEMECKNKFGDEYIRYSKKVPIVCFKIKCLKNLFEIKEN